MSADIPLLSNLSIFDNIALIHKFHTSQPVDFIARTIREQLEILGIDSFAALKPASVDPLTVFKVKVLRAVSLPLSKFLIDRPFTMLTGIADIGAVVKIVDLLDKYVEECTVFDYKWNSSRYDKIAPEPGKEG
ncbi:hypothetical protein J5834_06615 [bacterium]|nr:hypothetical protein [bacterium]